MPAGSIPNWGIIPGTNMYGRITNPASTTAGTTTGASNVPVPTTGRGPYGLVPGATTTVDPAALWNTFYPGLTGDVGGANAIIRSNLAGELTPEVQRVVTDVANARMVAGGVGGSPFAGSAIARDLGLTAMDLQNRGVQQFGNQLGAYQQNLIAPTVDLAQTNAILASAPNPQQAAQAQEAAYQRQQDRAFAQQQALIAQQFQQQMAYLDKYLRQGSSVGGGGSSSAPINSVSYYAYGPGVGGGALSSTPYSSVRF